MQQMDSFLDQVMASSGALLNEQLEAELARRRVEVGEEPDMPLPSLDAPFAGMPSAS